jgi:hypothetical protein
VGSWLEFNPGLGPLRRLRVTAETRRINNKPYYVRGGKLTPQEPSPCAVHGRTTQLCVTCNAVTCWKCAHAKAPPYLRVAVCKQCKIDAAVQQEFSNDTDLATVHSAAARQSVMKGAAFAADILQDQNRIVTQGDTAGRINAFQKWSASEGRPSLIVSSPSENLISRFIEARSKGEPSACSRGAVNADTIAKDLAAIRTWIAHFAEEHKVLLVDNTQTPKVRAELRWAKDTGVCDSKRKAAVPEVDYLRVYNQLRNATGFLHQSYFCALGSIWNLLPRRGCLASRTWDPAYLARDVSTRQQQAHLGQNPQPFLWGLDRNGDGFVRVLLSGEKNQAQKATTTRFATSAHFLGVDFPEDLHRTLTKMQMPKGPFLRKSRHSQEAWGQLEWRKFLDFLAAALNMPRATVGTTSLRRGYATSLRENGVSSEYIRMIGYWRSDASEEYDGAAMNVRLDAQKRKGILGSAVHVPNQPLPPPVTAAVPPFATGAPLRFARVDQFQPPPSR